MNPPPEIIELQGPGDRARIWLFVFSIIMPAAFLLFAFMWRGGQRLSWPGMSTHWLDHAIAVLMPLVVLAIIWFATSRALRRHRIELRDRTLTIVAGWWRARLDLRELLLDKARVGSLDEHLEWKPWLRTNGVAIPGFRAGWFRTRDFQRVFACVADPGRVLWIPTTGKYSLVLQAEKSQDLLDHLRARATDAALR